MPLPLLRAYARAMPRLEATESLLEVSRIAVGSGAAKPDAARRVRADWERLAFPVPAGEVTESDRRGAAALLGIRVVEESA